MERLEPKLNAVCYFVATAMQDAERHAVDLRSGHDLGASHGIPVTINDLIEVKDTPTVFDRSLDEDMASADGNEDTAGIQQRVLVQSLMDFLTYLGIRSPLRNAVFLVRVLHDALLACSLHHRLIGLR